MHSSFNDLDKEDHKESTSDKQNNSGSNDSNKMLRDHDNIVKNLRHELNQLKDHVG